MCSNRSPGLEMARRSSGPNSRKLCSEAGRGWPNKVSHAAEPKPQMHDRLPEGTRFPTERVRAAMSAHQPRTLLAASLPGTRVATIKIALRVMGLQMDCASGVD